VAQSSDTPGNGRLGATGFECLDLQVVPGPAWEPPEPQYGIKTSGSGKWRSTPGRAGWQ